MCGAILLTACGGVQTGSEDTSPAASSASATTSATTSSAAPATPLEVSDKAAQNLCDMMRPELSNWRVQGPTLGRIGLNAMVHEWALTNGGINAQVLADKAVVDRVTVKVCPDVHDEAVQALELPDLASGLAF
ncbi:hypothetical protein [Nocardia grenadensis]|uniref:hypothetical protein n=1 Tax=Nocardia grenadensis TaxID=931537 RepID=UPI001FE22D16|nr:hypothetical protein [Nocardia grenadensis]